MASIHLLATRAVQQNLSETTVIAAAAGGGGAVLIAIVILLILLFRQITKHRRLLADLEQRGINFCRPNHCDPQVAPTRPVSALRRSSFIPFGAPSGWSNLDSSEDISFNLPNRPIASAEMKAHKQRAESGRIGWPFSKRKESEPGLPLNEVSAPHLSAIIESPVGLDVGTAFMSGGATQPSNDTAVSPKDNSRNIAGHGKNRSSDNEELYCSSPFVRTDASESTDSLKPKPLFSSSDVREGPIKPAKKRSRAQTVGTTIRHVSPDSRLSSIPPMRPRLHTRSVSLGTQNPASAPPDGPVPPLPLNATTKQSGDRPRSWIDERTATRLSGSSLESVGSSVLASPKIKRSHSAKLKDGPSHNWSNSLIAGPRPLQKSNLEKPTASPGEKSAHDSIKSSAAQFGCEPEQQGGLSRETSENSLDDSNNWLSVPQIDTAERVRLSRLSAGSPRPTQVYRTPRRSSRLSVASNGSPTERPRTSALREVSGTQSELSQGASQVSSRASSTRSSNGNPFQWDPSPMQSGKPSALKGSPSARKSHRRSNCVRISLSPTIIGSRRPSPSPSMADIAEESPEQDKECERPPSVLGFPGTRALPRPPSVSTFAPDVKLNPRTLRASLTPSSPTLSLNNFARERDISNSSFSFTASPPKFSRPRGDSNASNFTIPTFPSPGKAITALTKSTIPTPTFSFSRPSGEFDEENEQDNPLEFRLLAEPVTLSDSPPPLELSEVHLVAPSPPADVSFILGQLHTDQLDEERTAVLPSLNEQPSTVDPSEVLLQAWPWTNTLTRNDTQRQVESPPLSPKSQRASPEPNWGCIAQKPPPSIPIEPTIDSSFAHEELESSASAGAEEGTQMSNKDEISPLTATNKLKPNRPETPAPTAFQEPPASPLRRSIAQLRRMNSDAKKSTESRAARRYLKMGKEPSAPVLEVDAMLAGRVGFGRERYDSWVSIPEIPSELLGSKVMTEAELESFDFSEVICGTSSPAGEESRGERQRKEDLEGLGSGDLEEDDSRDTVTALDDLERVKRKEAETSVWEDGESYWNAIAEPEKCEVIDRTVMTAKRDGGNRSKIEHPRIAQLRGEAWEEQKVLGNQDHSGVETPPPVKIQPPTPGSAGSPGSLYDENGFYKGE